MPILDSFSARELATGIWLVVGVAVLFALAHRKPEIRRSLTGLIRALLNCQILVFAVSTAAYASLAVFLLFLVDFWHAGFLKDTILWFVFSGIVLAFRSATSTDDKKFLLGVVKDGLRVTIVVEYLVNAYVFPLVAELAIQPFVAFVILLDTVAQRDERNAIVTKYLTTPVITFFGLAIIVSVLWRAIGDLNDLATAITFQKIFLAPLLSTALVPWMLMVQVYACYDSMFHVLLLGYPKSRGLIRYAKLRLILHCGLSPRKIRNTHRTYLHKWTHIRIKSDVDAILESASKRPP